MTSPEARITAEFLSKTDLSEGLAIFRFTLSRDFVFKAGQHATLWLTHRGRTVPRPYSIASSPSQTRLLEFYINLVAEGRLTPSLWDEEVLHGLKTRDPGTELSITGPKGRFVLDPDDRRDLLFVASGTGLAPFMSMIRKLNEDSIAAPDSFSPRRVYVVHGVSYSSNLGYHQELSGLASETLRNPGRKLALVYLPTISRPHLDPAWKGLTGRAETLFEPLPVQASLTLGLEETIKGMLGALLAPSTHAVYVCGHPGTIDNLTGTLATRGFKPDADIKREKYYP
jgi:CDP-4-dehydro-6-deoxyglucose reductase